MRKGSRPLGWPSGETALMKARFSSPPSFGGGPISWRTRWSRQTFHRSKRRACAGRPHRVDDFDADAAMYAAPDDTLYRRQADFARSVLDAFPAPSRRLAYARLRLLRHRVEGDQRIHRPGRVPRFEAHPDPVDRGKRWTRDGVARPRMGRGFAEEPMRAAIARASGDAARAEDTCTSMPKTPRAAPPQALHRIPAFAENNGNRVRRFEWALRA